MTHTALPSGEVLNVSSPHTVMYAGYFHISPGSAASGSMTSFGAPQTRLAVTYDTELRQELIDQAEASGLQAETLREQNRSLDHGTFLPLFFHQEAGVNCPILRIDLSCFSPLQHYQLGQCVSKEVDKLGRRAVIVASGDLSHKLMNNGPYGYAPEGLVFALQATTAMESGNFLQFLTMDPPLCGRAAECGLRSSRSWPGRWTAWP